MNTTSDEQTKDPAESQEHKGWVAVDLDGTLAHYDGRKGPGHIGLPVPVMAGRVRAWLAAGKDVRIFTARVYPHSFNATPIPKCEPGDGTAGGIVAGYLIQQWCLAHLGRILPVTCCKDYGMVELYDDRCVFVYPNEGITHHERLGLLQSAFADVATSLGVRVEHGASFKAVADDCIVKARAGAAARAHQYEAVLALFDGAEDALAHAIRGSKSMPSLVNTDLERTHANIRRALPLLRELAGKKGQ